MLTVGRRTVPSTAISSDSARRSDVGHGLDLVDRLGLVDDHDELVAAHAADDAGPSDAADHAVGDHGEQVVAGGVAERVVDLLEPVDVDVEHPEGAHARGEPHRVAEQGEDGVAVGETGERIGGGAHGQLVLTGPLGGDVGDLHDQPAGMAVLVTHGAHREVAPQHGPVDADEPLLEAVGVTSAELELLLEGDVDGDVVGVGDLGEVHRPQLGIAALEEADHRRVHLEEAPTEVDQAHGDRRVVEQLTHDRLVAGAVELVGPDDRLVP